MSTYKLYDTTLVQDDSSLQSFVNSLLMDLDQDLGYWPLDPEKLNSEEFKDFMLDGANEVITDDLSRTDIDYQSLMEKYAKDIGKLLYDMDNNGYDLSTINLSFFAQAKECFEILLLAYINIHFDEIKSECFGHQFNC